MIISCIINFSYMSQIQNLSEKVKEFLSYETGQKHTWCSGCGNYGILNSITRALVLEGYKPHQVALAFDIGCSGNASDKIMTNTFHGLHGRAIPLASGMALANQNMPIIAMAGDGATLSEGINHFIHGIRNNYNMVFILHNNENYGLTTGQASAATRIGRNMNGTPNGAFLEPINACQLALNCNPSFVARSFSGDTEQLTSLIQKGLQHKGFAFIEVFQSCPTYNKQTTDSWYNEMLKDIKNIEGYDRANISTAREIVEKKDFLATGLLYENKEKLDYNDMQTYRNVNSNPVDEVKQKNISEIIKSFQ